MGRLYSMTDALAMQTIIAGTSYGPAGRSGIWHAGGWAGETRTYNSLKQLTGISSVDATYATPPTQNNGKIKL